MKIERTEFLGSEGQRLAARMDAPEGIVYAYALFAHCFTCGKDIFAASRIAQALAEHGIAVLRFDFTGLGASEGEFVNTNFSSNLTDLVAAANHLRTAYSAPSLLIGHSLGGAAVLAAASEIPEVRAVATIGAPSDPAHVTGLFRDHLEKIEAEGEAEVQLAGRPFRIKRQFLLDVAEQKLTDRIAHLRKALLVMHSPRDTTVNIVNAMHIFTAAKHPKSFVSLDDADHLLTRKRDAIYVANMIAAWSERYISSSTPRLESPKSD
jgi:alpha-beta hydrolase superfamily lysophospholipase